MNGNLVDETAVWSWYAESLLVYFYDEWWKWTEGIPVLCTVGLHITHGRWIKVLGLHDELKVKSSWPQIQKPGHHLQAMDRQWLHLDIIKSRLWQCDQSQVITKTTTTTIDGNKHYHKKQLVLKTDVFGKWKSLSGRPHKVCQDPEARQKWFCFRMRYHYSNSWGVMSSGRLRVVSTCGCDVVSGIQSCEYMWIWHYEGSSELWVHVENIYATCLVIFPVGTA